LSPDGRLVAVANYSGGSVIVHRVERDGRLGVKTAFFAHCHASKAVPERQEAPHAHGVTWAPGGRLLLVPDLGADRVFLYACDPASLALAPNPPQAWLDLPRGSGPRHACFSADGRHLYIVNELSNTVSVATYDEKAAMLTLVETVAALAGEPVAPSKAAEIAVHPAGHSVYASVRGADTLAVFARNAESGRLTLRAQVPVPAKPRHFSLSPDARWLLVAGHGANQVAVFSVDRANGMPTPTSATLATPKPVCLRF
jgi:6-phosphogluconolactonase